MKLYFALWLLPFLPLLSAGQSGPSITGQLLKGHKITLAFAGPAASEYDRKNPFLDYRMEVTFTQGKDTITVPGFYAADGQAAETSAESGNLWKVRFRPDSPGKWNYAVRFKEGKDIAVAENSLFGTPSGPDGQTGSFTVGMPADDHRGFLGKGRIVNGGDGYLRFSDTGEAWVKNGADSPENFLAYAGFDQTYRYGEKSIIREGEANPKDNVHHYEPHVNDWKTGDPTWQNGKGKGIIGALNYLASKGVNSQYLLTMNILGDGKDVWPYSDHNERYRFDCSKLDQWEIVFDHMDKLGMMIHFVLQETENECLLDAGHTAVQRKLYLRELVARFAHHPAVTWNLGEENGPADWSPVGQTDQQRKEMATFLKRVNPYPSFVVVHTHSDDEKQDAYLTPLLGFPYLDGPSMQIGNVARIHERIKTWADRSAAKGKPWVVCLDELGPAHKGVMPDSHDAKHDTVRHQALWGSLMAGAAGVEWYFGYRYPNNDLMLEDFRSRDTWWNQSASAVRFFSEFLPLGEMTSSDHLLSGAKGFCLAKAGELYAVYLPSASSAASISLESAGTFSVAWYNPRTGGSLVQGTVSSVTGSGKVALGLPPSEAGSDWAILIRKTK